MLRRFLLVGVFVVIQPGSIQQLAYATFIALLYLAVQLTAAPFILLLSFIQENLRATQAQDAAAEQIQALVYRNH